MTIGFAIMVHDAFDRAGQVARYWAERGCPVAIHVDKRVPSIVMSRFQRSLSDLDNVRFCKRFRCNWGTWSLVAASKEAASTLLDEFPAISHVFLASGSCLPLRPVAELKDYLAAHPDTDFIESVTIHDVPWTQGGLDIERFTLTFPFGWKSQRFLFDHFVKAQRALKHHRRIPDGLVPHLGSQWWCLTRRTLTDIFSSPDRRRHEAYFSSVWIPDESYFQTVARIYARNIESRSLTLSKFDFQGKPHLFFDDHLQILRRSDCFVARKVWPGATKLYDTFLSDAVMIEGQREPQPGKIDRVFSKAVQRRTRGRPGLRMPGRFPSDGSTSERTAAPYSVCCGLNDVFVDINKWIENATGMCVHNHLFAPNGVEFAEGAPVFAGALSHSRELRDYDPRSFLRNLIWNTRGERQCFQFGPGDTQDIAPFIAEDPNAHVTLVTGAWALSLFREGQDPAQVRHRAASFQKIETDFAARLRDPAARSHVRILSLVELLEQPMEVLQLVLDDAGSHSAPHLSEVPRMHEIAGFDGFLQGLKNQGMNPYLVGDFHSVFETGSTAGAPPRPYLVQ